MGNETEVVKQFLYCPLGTIGNHAELKCRCGSAFRALSFGCDFHEGEGHFICPSCNSKLLVCYQSVSEFPKSKDKVQIKIIRGDQNGQKERETI